MPEEMIVQTCAPTLAGIKTGSLFSCPFTSKEEITAGVRQLNQRLGPKGLRVLPMRITGKRVLIYIYRPQKLREDFSRQPVREILEEYGYPGDMPELCVVRLIQRLHESADFPHEIGLFLGYPPEDVRGFIENKAAHSKCAGLWKVYGDPLAAQALFAKYRQCTRVYCTQWKNGKSIEQLAVAGA